MSISNAPLSTKSTAAGFTLVELMTVVVILGILGSIGIVFYGRNADTTAVLSEVTAMMAEISNRQEEYFVEHGKYLATGSDETDTFPADPTGPDRNHAILVTAGEDTRPSDWPVTWDSLRIDPHRASIHCAYVVLAGDGDGTSSTGAIGQTFGMPSDPNTPWFYILAECDNDRDPTTNAIYFSRNESAEILADNEHN